MFIRSLNPFMDQDGNAAGSASTGTPAGDSTAAITPHQSSSATGAAANVGPQGAAATGAGTGTPGTPGAPGSGQTAAEDRSNWIPPHRFRDVSRRASEYQRQLEESNRRVQALAGVAPQKPTLNLPPGTSPEVAAQIEAARQEFGVVFPEYAKLSSEKIDQLLGLLDTMPQLQQHTDHYWKQLGSTTLRSLDSAVKDQIGELSKEGKQAVYGTLFNLLQTDEGLFERYQMGDPSLISDFVNYYKTHVLDPYHTRRASSATATIQAARKLPRGGNTSSIAPAAGSQAALDPDDEDAIHKRAFTRMKQRIAGTQARA